MKTPQVFVFGSNEAGRHGAGAALEALQHHATNYGTGFGYCSDSRGGIVLRHSFAVPTKNYGIENLTLERIADYVDAFLAFALARPDLEFKVTRLGCGLAGLKDEDMARLFWTHEADNNSNLLYDEAWKPYLPQHSGVRFWGTF